MDQTMEECNRDEALRAREISERKFNSHDLKGAKKFALKAQTLVPTLDGISQLISTLDVYIAAETKFQDESDWYGVLGLSPFSDEEMVKKNYRKLALQLHPDKNKSVGAEGAFKLISEAWSVLSDSSRKLIYDQKIVSSSTTNNNNISNNNSNSNNRVRRNRRNSNSRKSNSNSGSNSNLRTGVDTFWTSCNRCRMQYEYLRIYLNHNLLCPNCHNAFMAVETGFPCNGNSNSNSNSNSVSNSSFSYGNSAPKNSTSSNSYGNNSLDYSYNFNRSESRARRKHEETYSFNYSYNYSTNISNNDNSNGNNNYNYNPGGSAYSQQEKPKSNRPGRPPKRRRYNNYTETGQNLEKRVVDSERANGFSQGYSGNYYNNNNNNNNNNSGYSYTRMPARRNNFRDISQIDIRSMLMEKTKDLVTKKLNEWNLLQQTKEKKSTENYEKEKAGTDPDGTDETLETPDTKYQHPRVVRQPVSIDVPDPDFHDFDKDRTERAFDSDQVWATYDSEDGMPRLYAMVQKVISKKPFTIRMSFLNSKSNSELGPLNWVGSGFTKTCGDFRVGRYQVTDTVNIFSHRVKFEKGPRGIIKIVPQKGETWSLYKNWSPDWNELTPDDVIYKYEIVEIVEGYDAAQGVAVVPLVKVAGFRAVFHRHMDPGEVRKIPREEMFRFSHQIPSRVLTGSEGANAPAGSHELDPAATPVELLQVITEVKEQDTEMKDAE